MTQGQFLSRIQLFFEFRIFFLLDLKKNKAKEPNLSRLLYYLLIAPRKEIESWLSSLRHANCTVLSSSIVLGKSSKQHPVSIQNREMWDFSDQSTLVCPWVEVHWRKSLMGSTSLHQQCPARFVHLTWIGCKMGGKWPYKCSFEESCF